jgi:transitional endoplasmic reticulum ATPase
MNERSREYYRRMREFFKGGLPKEVQPPEYQ